jgi:carboxypeptidase C (cathepsin A)
LKARKWPKGAFGMLVALFICAAANGARAPTASNLSATPAPTPREFRTEHTALAGGRKVAYTAIVADTLLSDSKGDVSASLFTFTYLEKGAKLRPVVFIFNGGPGSASVWQHFGALGPRKVDFPDPVHPPLVAPFKIVDSPYSLLDVADLVFIDTVGTGFSRMLPGGHPEEFLGVIQDARAVADLIQAWLTRYHRWNSQKYVIGESYGTIRAVVLANVLAGGVAPAIGRLNAVSLNGIVVLGPAFDLNVSSTEGDDRRYLMTLPTMAATAWYHGKIDNERQTREEVVAAATAFSRNEYLHGLYMGSRLEAAERRSLADRLTTLTGIPAQIWIDHDLRMDTQEFRKLLLQEQKLQVGDYDSRYTLPMQGSGGDPVTDDPAMAQYVPAFVAAFNDYLDSELQVKEETPYVSIEWKNVNFRWDWGQGPGVSVPHNYATDLATAMRRNPKLRVLVGAGYYDLVTTYGSAEYVIAHASLPADRLTLRGYPSGHMIFMGEEGARKLSADLHEFIRPGSSTEGH